MALRDRRRRRAGDRDDVYWCNLGHDLIPTRILDRVLEHDDFLKNSGLLWLWRRAWGEYHSGVSNNRLEIVGDRDQYTRIRVNHYTNILRHIYVNITGEEPSLQPRATSTDYKSRAQVEDAQGMLEYYRFEKKSTKDINHSTESAIVCGEGYIGTRWDPMAGPLVAVGQPQIDPETGLEIQGAPIHDGDIYYDVLAPWNVIRDSSKESFKDCDWLITRRFVNRFDLIAARPDLRRKIMDLPGKWSLAEGNWTERVVFNILNWNSQYASSDDVCVYTLYHRQSPSVPLGRVVTVLDDNLLWSDESMEEAGYDPMRLPIRRCATKDMKCFPYGDTVAFDLLAPQQGVNLLHSTIMTNNAQHGVQSLIATIGSNATSRQLDNGMTLIEITPGPDHKLEPLQLTKTAAETFTYKDDLKNEMQALSAVNSVERGMPDDQLKSGVALALVEAQSLEFQKDLKAAHNEMIADVNTDTLRLFKNKVKASRLAAIVGKGNRSHVKEIKGEDVEGVDAVIVETGSALLSTAAGRVNLADQLIKLGQIETPEQLLSVITTGKIEPLIKHRQATFDLIQLENEQIMDGINPPVILTDQHHLHILEHSVVASDPEVRKQGPIITALLGHVQEHMNMLKASPPELMALLKMPVLSPMGAPPPEAGGSPGGQPAGDAMGFAPPEGAPSVPGIQAPVNPINGSAIPGTEQLQ